MSKYTIVLSNGNRLDNITVNGSMYVSKKEITINELNTDALAHITITEVKDDGTTENTEVSNAICDGVIHWPEGWLFNLREPTEEEMERRVLEDRLEETELALMELAEMIGG